MSKEYTIQQSSNHLPYPLNTISNLQIFEQWLKNSKTCLLQRVPYPLMCGSPQNRWNRSGPSMQCSNSSSPYSTPRKTRNPSHSMARRHQLTRPCLHRAPPRLHPRRGPHRAPHLGRERLKAHQEDDRAAGRLRRDTCSTGTGTAKRASGDIADARRHTTHGEMRAPSATRRRTARAAPSSGSLAPAGTSDRGELACGGGRTTSESAERDPG
jgi:hypothetical protein